ncbi:response regulator [Treponema sp.]|uniref:response regulator n=1 Tax=Treponema sp. TaxID=166 RepID=UPI001DC48025|nr:response regulator [Treponema sp.]MBS7241145.1 response regulator [Treponema sp.]MDY4133059.1 response regulator [Treponema sp.]
MTTLLIVDDSEIDRAILKNILSSFYNVIEADSGYQALEILNNPTLKIDGLILDINMPGLGGFEVLSLLDKSRHAGMKILLISAEAQKNNIIKAANFGCSGFFKKPYDKDQVLTKLKALYASKPEIPAASSVAVNTNGAITDNDLRATAVYAEKLRRVYLTYLMAEKKNDALYIHVSEIVHILLENYFAIKAPRDLTPEAIEIISQAAYFYDIGRAIVHQEKFKVVSQADIDEIPATHTIAGADLVAVNSNPNVAFFVKIASDICMHHHERYDGRGMPHGLKTTINNIYTQMTAIAIEFCQNFFDGNSEEITEADYHRAMGKIDEDKDAFRPDVYDLLAASKDDIVSHFAR